MSALQKLVQSKNLPPLPSHPSSGFKRNAPKKDYSSTPWNEYFQEKKQININGNLFQYYITGSNKDLIILFLHGGGFSGLSWALLSKALQSSVSCCCIALDMRGHGGTSTSDDSDMSANTLANDVCDFIDHLNIDCRVVLIGHSLGGAIAIHASVTNRIQRLAGLVVIDVVEGTALEALKSMRHVLHSRPSSFNSLEQANEWCVRTGYIRNRESARVSMIGQLVRSETTSNDKSEDLTISEEDVTQSSTPRSSHKYVWRINLSATEPFWEGWFKGMSSLFLSVPVPKILMLAGVDRLDKDLSIGQMQGKFQLEVVSRSGHAVHEDTPDRVASIITTFLTRHKLASKT